MDDGLSKCIQFKAMIQTAFSILTNRKLRWKEQSPGHFSTGELHKFEYVLKCDSNRLYSLCSDRHYETLIQWNASVAEHTRIVHHYETVDGKIYLMKKTPLGFNGIQWCRDPKIVLYRSVDELPIKMIGFWINALDDYKTFLTVICNYKTSIDHQMLERVCCDTPLFLSIFNPWKCSVCRKMMPSHELECRFCRRVRYWRCQNLQCYEAQRDKTTVCRLCGKERY